MDWDIEYPPILNQTQIDNLTFMTKWANLQGLIVTGAPYGDFSEMFNFWGPLLNNTNGAGYPGFSLWNLQTYGGGYPPDWFDGLAQNAAWLGNTQGFLKLMYGILINGLPPSHVESRLANWKKNYPGLEGGGIWQYEELKSANYTAKEYASAILQGLDTSRSELK